MDKIKQLISDKDYLTLWMNNLMVLYAFLLPISQTIKAVVFTLIVILFFIRGDVKNYLKRAWENKVIRAFVYLFLAYVIGLLWSEDLKEGLGWVKSIKYGLYLIVFYVVVDGRYIDKIVSAFIIGMLLSELISYGMMLGIMPWELRVFGIKFYQTHVVGDPSPFLNHIHYGVALALAVMLLAQKVVYANTSKIMKIFMSLFVVSATINIFITGGRTGYVAFFLLLLFLSITYLRKYFLALVIGGSLVFVTAYTLSPMFASKVIQTKESIKGVFGENANYETSFGVRMGIARYAFDVIKQNPLIGVGTGDSMKEIQNATPKKHWRVFEEPHEHNQFVSVLVKLGLFGFLIYLNVFYQIFKYKQEDKELRFIMLVSTLAIAAGTLTTQFNLRFFLPLWVLMLSVTMINRHTKTINNIELDDKRQLWQIVGIGFVLSVFHLSKQLF